MTQPVHDYPKEYYEKGVKVVTQDYARPFAVAKTTNYANLLRLRNWKSHQQAHEVLYTNGGSILEGATSAFFAWKDNMLLTAKDDVLDSMTGNLILRLAKKRFRIIRRPARMKELTFLTEAFLASTTRNIMPVVQIDKRTIGSGEVGPNTKLLMLMLDKYIRADEFNYPYRLKAVDCSRKRR